jgi:hypothetical protein
VLYPKALTSAASEFTTHGITAVSDRGHNFAYLVIFHSTPRRNACC